MLSNTVSVVPSDRSIVFSRDQYGALFVIKKTNLPPATKYAMPADEIFKEAVKLVAIAVKGKKIPCESDNMFWEKIRGSNKMIGFATKHDFFDIKVSKSGVVKVLICIREVEGTKYGQRTTCKDYYLIRKCGNHGVIVEKAKKSIAAKAAKQAGDGIGLGIAILEGKAKLVSKAPEIRYGFKLVRRNDNCELVSVWDDSPWSIGVRRGEKATHNHSGGFYYYRKAQDAINAAETNEVFGSDIEHDNLVLVAVEASGAEYILGSNKLCCTYLKPTHIIAEPHTAYLADELNDED